MCCTAPAALFPLLLWCTTEVTALIHWFLLVVASSMGSEENPRLLAPARIRYHVLSCDVFLAPSTITGSACMKQRNCLCCVGCCSPKFCVLNYLIVSVIRILDCSCRCLFDVYLNNALVQLLYLFLISFTPSNSRLVSKQLVSEFLQDAHSKKTRWWCGAAWHCFCLETFLGARPLGKFLDKNSVIQLHSTTSSFLKARPAKTPKPAVWNQGANFNLQLIQLTYSRCKIWKE